MDQSELRMKPPCERPLSRTSSQAPEESRRGEFGVFRVKFIGLYGTVGSIAICFWGESDLWSEVWPAMDWVVCLSILSLEGGVTVSNNLTERRQNGLKSVKEASSRHIWGRKTLFQMKLFTQYFYDRWFSYTIHYIHKLSHTPRILSKGSLWRDILRNAGHIFLRGGSRCIQAKTVQNTVEPQFNEPLFNELTSV